MPALSAAKQALLAKWLRGESSESRATPGTMIPRRVSSGPIPLSFEQQRLWFFHQLEPHSPLYTMPIAARLTGNLDSCALQKALDVLLARHEALRTVFVSDGPAQVVNAPTAVPMRFSDLRGFARGVREAEARRLLEIEAKRPFDLARDLMIRTTLLQLDDCEWLFLVLMHHIASDDWSWRIFCNELAAVYGAIISGQPVNLPETQIQYPDFVVWQRASLQGEALRPQFDYWKRELAGAPSVLELPADHSRPALQSFRGACEWLKLPPALCEKLHAASQRAGVTLFMTLLAGFEVLIHRYTGQEDLVIGSPVAGRIRGGVESVIGLFVNMLALRADLSGNPPFSDFLKRVQRTVLDGLAHQEMPFEKLVGELQPRRNSSHSPLIQVMFALQDELADNLRLPGLAAAPFQLGTGTAKFDLTFTIVRSGANLSCCAEYNTDLFEQPSIQRMLTHYQTLLEGIVENPAQRLAEFPLLAGEERRQVLLECNLTAADFPRNQCVHELFQARARETPEAVGVEFGPQQMSYRELDSRANTLARHLRRLGAGPESLVAVCMDRSLEMIIALMGILKSGAAYVPLDPSYPRQRLRFMLDDSKAGLLLTLRHQKAMLEELQVPEARVICMDDDWPSIAAEGGEDSRVEANSENLAYVIYTSGSTGRPKGVRIPHRAVVNVLHAMAQKPGITRDDALLAVTSISFDIAALEIFLPLTTGARLVLADTRNGLDGARLAGLIADSGITVMQATPSLWRFLVDSGWAGDKRLKVLSGGESLSRELADKLLARGGEVWNLYGPTETTIWSAACKAEPGRDPISIGRPIANTQIYLLDHALQPVPIGVPGELHIGGEGLARGYLNRPELTSEKFIANPFSIGGKSERLYKTGDMARRRPDGIIEILGRTDHQIKLRGHRIDPGEIESSLRQHPGVREALVVLRGDETDQKQLVAYLICEPESQPDSDNLREFLKGKMPDYMVPSVLVPLDRFPMTPNGKIDRNALPLPAPSRVVMTPVLPPRTPTETTLAEIWREVLKLDCVSVHDNFFKLGGHSLLAMQVVSRARKTFGVDLSLRSIFETPTIAGMAQAIALKQNQSAIESIPRRRNFSPHQAKELLDRLDELSNAEVESLLEQSTAAQVTTA